MYAYDNIGNRDTYTKGTGARTTHQNPLRHQAVTRRPPAPRPATASRQLGPSYETASSPVTGQNLLYDADGNVTESYVVGDFDGDGAIGFSDLAIFSSSYGYCEGDPEFDERANLVTGDDPECIDVADQSAFMSLFGLSATSVMRAEMDWDAENRLAAYIPLNQSGGAKKVTFKYDYRGRRIEKNVYAWNSGGIAWHTNATERRRFLWNGWLMLRETIETDSASDGTFEATRVKTYTWGKDLGGGLESAGGIGGLLAVYDDSATSGSTGDDLAYVYMYDANGNVGQVCDLSQSTASASIVAKYEYDAYGNAAVASGTYASSNTYRFSTKPWDDETGLGYWGYRYYDPRLGRWMSRDPIGERGGRSLYKFISNSPVGGVDARGLLSLYGDDIVTITTESSGPIIPPTDDGPRVGCTTFQDVCTTHFGRCDQGWSVDFRSGFEHNNLICICGDRIYADRTPPKFPDPNKDPCDVIKSGWLDDLGTRSTPGRLICSGGHLVDCANPFLGGNDGKGGCDVLKTKSKRGVCACRAGTLKLNYLLIHCPDGCKDVADGNIPTGGKCSKEQRDAATKISQEYYIECLKQSNLDPDWDPISKPDPEEE